MELVIAGIIQKEIARSLADHRLVDMNPVVKKVIAKIETAPQYRFWYESVVGNKILDCQIAKILQYEFLKAITAKPVFHHWISFRGI